MGTTGGDQGRLGGDQRTAPLGQHVAPWRRLRSGCRPPDATACPRRAVTTVGV